MHFIAHKKENGTEIQTVSDHCENVARLSSVFGKDISISAIVRLAGLLHDAGKYAPSFQKYISGTSDFRRGEIDHAFCGAKYICAFADQKHLNNAYYNVSRLIARVIVSHHGIHDWLTPDGSNYLQQRMQKENEYDFVCRKLAEIYSDADLMTFLEDAQKEYVSIRKRIQEISKDAQQFAFYLGLYERTVQSVLIDADRTDTANFCNGYTEKAPTPPDLIWEKARNTLNQRLASFDHSSVISHVRSSISERCSRFAETETGICQLIVPTGGGKTLASIRFALNACLNFGKKRIFYVAPFMSILEQNSSIFREIMGDENFLEHHSNVMNDVDCTEELMQYELLSERWDTPMIATTMVQFMNTLFSDKITSVRRMHNLAHSVIIIDEVQSIPVNCVSMFIAAMNYLSKICGCTVVLCTATQPDFCLNDARFQLLLDEQPCMTGDSFHDFAALKRTEVIPVFKNAGYSNAEIADFCYSKYLEEKAVLLIVNTKAVAREVWMLLNALNQTLSSEEQAHIIHLSTNMCPKHRKKQIAQMKEDLKNGKRMICVSTQLIEAGVDISFPCVIRSLSGLDRIAQAAGRCNRNGESAEPGKVYVIHAREEKTEKMREITSGKSVAMRFFHDDSESDLFSPKTIASYFRIFYQENMDVIDFPVKAFGIRNCLVNLLSLNKEIQAFRKDPSLKYSAQAFRTAGRLFQMIDENAVSVVAPYDDEGKALILKIEQGCDVDRLLLRKLQSYTIGIPEYLYRKLLENGSVFVIQHDIAVLAEENYSMDFGFTETAAASNWLAF